MSSWAERVHRRAADFGNVVTSCGHPGSSAPTYPYRLEKVKFGVPLEEVCKNDNIPGPLLVLILKLNKESPNRRDVFRAPGHQGAMKKLIHFLQAGRLVNVDNYSVYTIASVLKKFLRKIPNGIFGRSGEEELFAIIELSNESEQIERLHKLLQSLPKYTQHLLVLLFGTFRVIASNAAHAGTGMTSEALGVSVAPSFFQSCVSDGKTARMEDVLKFKVATKIMKHIIDKFATHDLFGRENYEYYARVTGRILKVQDEWICSFQYPPPPRGKQAQQKYALQHSLEAEKTWLQCQCERWGLLAQEESRSTPALLTSSSSALDNSVVSLGVTPEHSFMESCARLSVSLEGPGLFAMTSSPLPARKPGSSVHAEDDDDDIDEDDYHNDDDDDDHEGDDDEEDNDNNHFNQHFRQQQQQHHHFTQQPLANADDDDEEFANELDISNGGNGGGANENIENLSYKANFRTCQSYSSAAATSKLKSRSAEQTPDNTFTDSQEDVDDEMTNVVKRRYKQNKKKSAINNTAQIRVQQQQQRRFRTSTTAAAATTTTNTTVSLNKSFETKNCDFLTNDYEYIAKPKINTTATTNTASSLTLKALAVDAATVQQSKSRVCSRCKRGIRHSSSCSSSTASGGGAGGAGGANGSGMTMEELRAVNRYAESTKSLSYLPQVHERQTARMRTRSEWFLGPKDGDLLCVPPNTCSNCCLSAVNLQTAGNYLGGGSTRDMRRMLDIQQQQNQQQQQQHHVNEAVNTSLYLYYKQRQQHQQQYQQLPLQRQSFHLSPEHMDTDESFASFTSGSNSINQQMNLHSMQQQLTAIQQQQQQQLHQQLQPQFNTRQAQEGQGLFLDTNYGRYDFDDKDILITTTTTTTDNHFNYNNNNNKPENNNNKDDYTISNRQHLMKTSSTTSTTTNDMTLQTLNTTPLPLSSTATNNNNNNSSSSNVSLYHLHAKNNSNNHNSNIQMKNKKSLRSLNISQYYSTESLLNPHNIDYDEKEDHDFDQELLEEPGSSKLSYQSSRLPTPQRERLDEMHLNTSQYLNSTLTSHNANTITTTTAKTTNSHHNLSSKDVLDGDITPDVDDIDYVVSTHYRHSTPMLQRRRLRQQQALRRQRLPSNSSSLYQSFNASLQAPMSSAPLGSHNRFSNTPSNSISNYESQSTLTSSTAAGAGGGSGSSGVAGSSSSGGGNSNFVSIIFNVLDFLF
ncbi:Rho GTPase-activating protein 20 [Lucilia cuprina]|nr:Rho GTPase-activating protein 20 [Lucilia cuprina]